MIETDVSTALGRTDIYLVDQIMKDRYRKGERILDAGCGTGRNLHWFFKNNFDAYAIDNDAAVIRHLAINNSKIPSDHFRVNAVELTDFENHFFDHIICSAVLHFAKNTIHLFQMLDEMHRVLTPGGTLFIRMASNLGIEDKVQLVSDNVYQIPDGSIRFLLTRDLLQQILTRYAFTFLEDFKTVNVNDVRCMSTLMLKKN